MVKTQTSIRMSDATRAKLDWLAERHGTATEVIAVAIDRMHREEHKMEIRYGFHGADLFNGWDNEDSYDVAESAQKYADMVEAKLREQYPGAEVEVVYDLDTGGALPHSLMPAYDGQTDHVEVGTIEHIAGEVYQDFEWTVSVD